MSILRWTDRYCNMQYLDCINGKKVPRRHFIALRLFSNGKFMVTYTDKDKNAHLHQSNFGYDIEFYGEFSECIAMVEQWIEAQNIK